MSQSLAEMGEVAKAFPAIGMVARQAATRIRPVQSSFMRGVKGRKLTPAKNPRSAAATRPFSPMQMRANRAGMFVNRNRGLLTAAGAGGAAGAAAGFGASQVNKAAKLPFGTGMSKPRNLNTHTLGGKKRFTRKSRAEAASRAPGLAAANPNTAANPFSRMNMDMGMKPVANPFTGKNVLR
jgi:hypothetical protein